MGKAASPISSTVPALVGFVMAPSLVGIAMAPSKGRGVNFKSRKSVHSAWRPTGAGHCTAAAACPILENIHQRTPDGDLTMRNIRTNPLPIACTLSAGAYQDRLTWIAALNRELLRSHRQKGLELELVYELEAAARVRTLVREEQACCAFLHFTISEATDTITLRIEVPAEARDHAAEIFAPFLGGATEEVDRPTERAHGTTPRGIEPAQR